MSLIENAIKYNSQLTADVRVYLNGRGINDEIIEKYQLGYDPNSAGWITIPIRDSGGEILFFKRKKHPFDDDIDPIKFLYEPEGCQAILFNTELIKDEKYAVLCEGEMDALLLTAKGIPAISSTSGASCFKEEWAMQLSHLDHIVICYDNDESGRNGALHAADILYSQLQNTEIRIFYLPDIVGLKGDITDYIIRCGNEPQTIMAESKKYLPQGLMTAKDFCEGLANTPQPKWLIDQFLPYQGITFISGREKSGKTIVSHQMAKCLTDGTPLFGKYAVNDRTRILIVDKENNDNDRKERLEFAGSDKSEAIIWYEMSNFNIDPSRIDGKEMDKLIKVVIKEKIGVVIFDPFVLIHNGNEDNASDMSRILGEIKKLNKINVSVIILHHMNKSNETRGSTAIAGDANMVFYVSSTANSKDPDTFFLDIFCKYARCTRNNWHVRALLDTRKLGNCFTLLDKEAEKIANSELQKNTIIEKLHKFGGIITRPILIQTVKGSMSDETLDKLCLELGLEDKITMSKDPQNNNIKTIRLI